LGIYGPTEAAINKSWKPGNIEKVNCNNRPEPATLVRYLPPLREGTPGHNQC
jgi:hypothetical protein